MHIMNKKLNRTTVYLIIVSVVLLITNATLGFFLTRESSSAMKSLIQNRMLDISNTAAAMLDGDVLGSIRAEDENKKAYYQNCGNRRR